MQRFDEKNFVNLVVEEEGSEDPEVIQTYFTSESKVAYSIVATIREGKCRIVIVSLVIKKEPSLVKVMFFRYKVLILEMRTGCTVTALVMVKVYLDRR
jgi:hypothetical protein